MTSGSLARIAICAMAFLALLPPLAVSQLARDQAGLETCNAEAHKKAGYLKGGYNCPTTSQAAFDACFAQRIRDSELGYRQCYIDYGAPARAWYPNARLGNGEWTVGGLQINTSEGANGTSVAMFGDAAKQCQVMALDEARGCYSKCFTPSSAPSTRRTCVVACQSAHTASEDACVKPLYEASKPHLTDWNASGGWAFRREYAEQNARRNAEEAARQARWRAEEEQLRRTLAEINARTAAQRATPTVRPAAPSIGPATPADCSRAFGCEVTYSAVVRGYWTNGARQRFTRYGNRGGRTQVAADNAALADCRAYNQECQVIYRCHGAVTVAVSGDVPDTVRVAGMVCMPWDIPYDQPRQGFQQRAVQECQSRARQEGVAGACRAL